MRTLKAWASIWIVLVLAVVGGAAEPSRLGIDPPESVEVGRLIVVEVAEVADQSTTWIVLHPRDLDYRIFGQTFVAASGVKATTVEAICLTVNWESRQQWADHVSIDVIDPDGDGDEDDNDNDDQDQDEDGPPPGKREVLIIYESADSTPEFLRASRVARRYCLAKKHAYLCLDQDTKGPDGTRAAVVREGLEVLAAEGIALPAVIVRADGPGGKVYETAYPLPKTEDAMIALIKELGG